MSRPVKNRRTMPANALSYCVDEAFDMIGVGKTTGEELIASGQLRSFKVGRRRLVSHRALEDFIAKRERAA